MSLWDSQAFRKISRSPDRGCPRSVTTRTARIIRTLFSHMCGPERGSRRRKKDHTPTLLKATSGSNKMPCRPGPSPSSLTLAGGAGGSWTICPRTEPVLSGAGPALFTRASQSLHICSAGSGELPEPTEGRTRKVKRAANKHLNTGNQILWLMQKTLMKNEVNVGEMLLQHQPVMLASIIKFSSIPPHQIS